MPSTGFFSETVALALPPAVTCVLPFFGAHSNMNAPPYPEVVERIAYLSSERDRADASGDEERAYNADIAISGLRDYIWQMSLEARDVTGDPTSVICAL